MDNNQVMQIITINKTNKMTRLSSERKDSCREEVERVLIRSVKRASRVNRDSVIESSIQVSNC